jgi:hypothetical protein
MCIQCRLPEGPDGTVSPVQFAAGLVIKRDTLYISYGWYDCYTALAEVRDIFVKLQLWQDLGMGTQLKMSPGHIIPQSAVPA